MRKVQSFSEINEESIEMIGEKLADIEMDWEPAVPANSTGGSEHCPGENQYHQII